MKPLSELLLYRPTVSRFKDILSPTGKESMAAPAYMRQILEWTFFDEQKEEFSSFWTERGKKLEEEARVKYVEKTGIATMKPKFIFNKEHLCGCFMDGESVTGGIEIKCLKEKNHLEIENKKAIPLSFMPQLQGTLLVTGKQWIDFVSYMPERELYIHRVFPDNVWIGKMKTALKIFNDELTLRYENFLVENYYNEVI